MADTSDRIVELRGVSKTYPGAVTPALSVDELSIRRGEFFSILGPSGSGKTTALKLIAGFERPDTGRILIDGIDVTDVPAFKRDVRTVFQSYALFPHMTVADNVEYPLLMAGVERSARKRQALEALGLVEMSGFERRYPHQLSGGQKQRVALARAFVGRPKILLLDEPLSALDLNLRHQMQHLLVELQRELDLTFVYVTHDQGEALSMSNRVAVVNGGTLQQLDAPGDIYYAPRNPFIAQFIGKSNFFPVEIAGTPAGQIASLDGIRFQAGAHCRPGAGRLCMRFEAMAVGRRDAPPNTPARLDGIVSDVLFLGSSIEVKVTCGPHKVIALLPSSRVVAFGPLEEVVVGFDPADGHLFNV